MDSILLSNLQARLQQLHPVELENLVLDALAADGYHASRSTSQRYDIDATKHEQHFAIEVRRQGRNSEFQRETIERIFSKARAGSRKILVVPDTHWHLTRGQQRTWNDLAVEVWDLAQIASLLDRAGILGPLLRHEPRGSQAEDRIRLRSDELRTTLASLPRGREHAALFEDVCADISEHLFAPALGTADRQSSDRERRNRRDFVMENVAETGFWARARTQYQADYVVFDAKNYSAPIDKTPILDISHYLSSFGLGLFAILMTREGASNAAKHAAQQQWIASRKLIIILGDTEIGRMLDDKASGRDPAIAISESVASFRKSI